ncbi:hypothetical protein [Actinomadura sp. 7K507]|uniref:hypothetical protein n=1 Tax=Actinomadura sp. 7K507 TaxID=2530365 RepID=UPI00105368BB|nr:hypothetical protein [Actinomadura sp. 7K507]TDC78124.1 hypothetical protein E1285_37810 [Actinomadura sp. 7K507]
MSDHHRTGRLDRHTADRLLDGGDGHALLQNLLSAAAAPAQPGELAGEDTAVAAFNAAPRPAHKSHVAALRRFLTVKVLAVVGTLILTGGAAYATINNHLHGGSPEPSPTPTLHHSTSTSQDSTPAPHDPPSAPPSKAPPSKKRPSPSGSPSAGTSANPPGRVNAPGQQKETPAPQNTKKPPRGRGNENGSPPGENSGNGNNLNGTGTGSGNGNGNGNGNGTGSNGSPPGSNSGNGNGPPADPQGP